MRRIRRGFPEEELPAIRTELDYFRAELPLELQRFLQPIQNEIENAHCSTSTFDFDYFPLYPKGFWLCHFHASLHISSMPRFAVQPSSFFASDGSAQHSAMSPGRRGLIL